MATKISALYNDRLVKTSSWLFAASMVTNISNYAFQIVMGRLLTPREYGFMNALLALFMMMAVPVATLLMVVTRKTAEYKANNDFGDINSLYRFINYRILFAGLAGLTVFISCAPFIQGYLHGQSVVPVIILGIAIFTALVYPVNIAVLQGVQDYVWLGINQGAGGPAKLFFCVVFVLAGFSVSGVMAGLIATSFLLWFISYIPLRKYMRSGHHKPLESGRVSFREVFPVFVAVLASSVLTQADLVLVSRYFSSHEAGIYASAAILGKAVMYIPGAVVLAMFPMVSEHHVLKQNSRHLLIKSLGLTLAISGTAAVLFYLFPNWIVRIIYGAQYQEAGAVLQYYGLAMLPLAVLSVLMNYVIAKGKTVLSAIMVFGAVLEVMALILFRGSLTIFVFNLLAVGVLVLGVSSTVLILQTRASKLTTP